MKKWGDGKFFLPFFLSSFLPIFLSFFHPDCGGYGKKGFSWTIFCNNPWHSVGRTWMCGFMSRTDVTPRWWKIQAERIDSRSQSYASLCITMELKSKLIRCRTMDLNHGLWSAEGWTNTWLSFQKSTRNPFTTKKCHLVRRNPLRRNNMNNAYRLQLHLHPMTCRWNHWWKVFRDLEADDPNITTPRPSPRPSPRKWWSNWVGKVVSWRTWRTKMDESIADGLSWQKGSDKQRFQYCLDSTDFLLYVRALQGHSGRNKVDPSVQDNVEIPYNWIECICHAGSSHDCRSHYPIRVDCKRERYERRKTNSILHSRGSCDWT